MQAAWMNEHLREAFIDFHTGACGRDMMANFDAEQYVDTLIKANANRHVSFIKDHHGWAYYPTEAGARHPHLKGDMFGQIAAECHRRGMPVMAYYNVTRDGVAFDENPDWRQTKRDGSFVVGRHIKHVCVNSPYVPERMWPMVDETMASYPFIKGFFFDATVFMPGTCFCEYCKRKMELEGVNPDRAAEVSAFRIKSLREHVDTTSERVQAKIPDAAIYYNCGDYIGKADAQKGQLFMCIESLASAWGYERTPFFGSYYRSKDIHVEAMTGRFHGGWADYGGVKPDCALQYEAAVALSLGASLSIGDQGNPDGTLDAATYATEGKAFAYYAEREEWVKDTQSLPYVAQLCCSFQSHEHAKQSDPSNYGLFNALTEENVHFDVIDEAADLAQFTALVTEDCPVDAETATKLRYYVAGGGRLLTLGETVFTGSGKEIMEDVLGVEYRGLSSYTVHYFRVPDGDLNGRLPCSDWTTYGHAAHLRPTTAEGLAELVYPYTEAKAFRTVSHQHGHPGEVAPFPSATMNTYGQGVAAAIVSPVGRLYYEHSYPPIRIFLKNVLDALIPPDHRVVELKAPLSAEIRVSQQADRTIVHLLNFHLNRSSNRIKVIEEIPPVLDAEVRLLREAAPQRVYLAPENEDLSWTRDAGHIVVQISRYDVHAMIVVE